MTLRVTGRQAGAAAVVLAVAVTAAGLLAACGSAGQGGTTTVAVDPSGSTSVSARVGDSIILRIEANPTTGYTWSFTAGDTFVIESSDYVPSPAPSDVVGGGGTQVVTLKVTKTGTSELTGTYARSWETPEPGASPDLVVSVTGTE